MAAFNELAKKELNERVIVLKGRIDAMQTIDELRNIRRDFVVTAHNFAGVYKEYESYGGFQWHVRLGYIFEVLDNELSLGNEKEAKASMISNLQAILNFEIPQWGSINNSSLVNPDITVKRKEYIYRLKELNKSTYEVKGARYLVENCSECGSIINSFMPVDDHQFSYSYSDFIDNRNILIDKAYDWSKRTNPNINTKTEFNRLQERIKTSLSTIILCLEDKLSEID